MYYVYILFSKKLSSFYIGETNTVEERITQHNTGFYKDAYTSKTNDWQLYLSIECYNRSQARRIETHIKKMKSKKYIENLKIFPELISKLLDKFS
ncbi:GIY-YIG nuclease family protein [Altibacter sp.]|uniref:GIY-YIG nuclease family protein n=1 Tax=Altibacter sp. TaxID=2024823 RepID=UPI000C8EDF2F|nr:GIY-YIG nuclease family protein [Altibacter sp.]MAP54214.1 endonuclease [Altibacter sp.]|tara:strand:- start:55 stop:339 length:285 start_codon:yes stop_codon:yes gene_type:complete